MPAFLKKIKLNNLLLLVYALFLLLLFKSVIITGLTYQYDIDELGHIQYVYLLINKVVPYISFDFTLTPLFHWTFIPLFKIFGFTFTTIQKAKILMIVLFILRVLLTFLLVNASFGRTTAVIFLAVFLLDPFTIFSSMQIRPDNLMISVFTLGLLIFYKGLKNQNNYLFFNSGLLFSLSSLILLKMLPSVAVIFLLFALFCFLKKNHHSILIFTAGLVLPVIFFLLYAANQKFLPEMIQQVIFDRVLYNASLLNQGSVWFYYKPDNAFIYGFGGRPPNWIYAIILPFISISGSLVLFYQSIRSKKINHESFFKIVLIFLFFSQILWLLTVKGIFSQYFLTLSYLLAILASFLLSKLNRLFLLIIFIYFSFYSTRANYKRAIFDNRHTISNYEKIWKIIPADEATFPNILFRPIVYPLTFGTYIGDAPKKVFERWKPLVYYLEKKQVKYVLLGSYDFIFIDPKTADYIKTNYTIISPEHSIWKKNQL